MERVNGRYTKTIDNTQRSDFYKLVLSRFPYVVFRASNVGGLYMLNQVLPMTKQNHFVLPAIVHCSIFGNKVK